jgi:hypothetical protein
LQIESDAAGEIIMTIERLKELFNAQPFRPFIIHLADGREVPVHHRDFIMAVPSGRTIFVAQQDDSVNIIDLLLVTDLELNRRKNGIRQRRRRRDG